MSPFLKRAARALVLAGLAAVGLALPGVASASEASVTGEGALRIGGLPLEVNKVEVAFQPAPAPGALVITDEAGIVTTDPACVAVDPNQVSCGAGGVKLISAVLGDRDDVMMIDSKGDGAVPRRFGAIIQGGGGDDVMQGGAGADRIYGQDGRDVPAGGGGADLVSGGTGSDGVIGFQGDDRLLGGRGPDALFGQKGRDSFFGGVGADVLVAKDGRRDLRINCGPGPADSELATRDRVDPAPISCQATPKPKKTKSRRS